MSCGRLYDKATTPRLTSTAGNVSSHVCMSFEAPLLQAMFSVVVIDTSCRSHMISTSPLLCSLLEGARQRAEEYRHKGAHRIPQALTIINPATREPRDAAVYSRQSL